MSHKNWKLEKSIFIGCLLLSLLIHAVLFLGTSQLDLFNLSIPSLDIMELDSAFSEAPASKHSRSLPARPEPAEKLHIPPASPTTTENTTPPPETAAGTSPQQSSAPPISSATPPVQEEKPAVAPLPQIPKLLTSHREILHYDIYWSGALGSVHVGSAVIDALNKNSALSITTRVNSNAVISAFYRVEDLAECNIVDGRASSFKLKVQEGKHRRDRETIFDYAQDKITLINNLKKDEKHFPMHNKQFWDIVSGFYYFRTIPLTIGQKSHIDIFDNGKFVNMDVDVIRTEKKKLFDGKEVDTIVVKPIIVTEGLFNKDGDVFIWLTNDAAKTPVLVETTVKIGRVKAELHGIEIEK